MDFWTKFTQETNVFKDRTLKNPDLADPGEADVLEGRNKTPNVKAALDERL